MTSLELMKLLGNAQDEYIMASRKRPTKRRYSAAAKIAAIAACGVILIGIGAATRYKASSTTTTSHEDQASIVLGGTPETAVGMEASAQETDSDALSQVTLLSAAQPPAAPITLEEQSENWTENQVTETTSYALSAFSYQLSAKVLSGTEESRCFSPLSLYEALAVLTSGAQGSTQEQLLSLLGQSSLDTLKSETQKLYKVNQRDDETDILKIANSLWLDENTADGGTIQYQQDWVMAAAADYYCDVYAADFQDSAACKALASWISLQTGGLMDDSLEDLQISSETVMTILNTVWYQANWAEEFNEENTSEGDFTTGNGETVSCDYLHKTELTGSVVETDSYYKSVLTLSTGNMYFVLPKEGTDLDALLEEGLLWQIFESNDYQSAEVHWSIPKFETNSMLELNDVLQALGVTDAFTETADFSSIAAESLYLSDVRQGTHISINEEGVEASAYTMESMLAAADPDEAPVVEMNLNRPFLYLITSNDGSPLFIGVVRTPN